MLFETGFNYVIQATNKFGVILLLQFHALAQVLGLQMHATIPGYSNFKVYSEVGQKEWRIPMYLCTLYMHRHLTTPPNLS